MSGLEGEVRAMAAEAAVCAEHAGRACIEEDDVWLAAHIDAERRGSLFSHSVVGKAGAHEALLERALSSKDILLPPPSGDAFALS